MTGPLRYDGSVTDTGTTTMTLTGELREVFENLYNFAKTTLADSWQGEAASSFDGAKSKWNAEVTSMSDNLNQHGRAVVTAADNAFHADRQGAGLFNV